MATTPVSDFINSLRKQNISDEEIKKQLLQAGWNEQQVSTTMSAVANSAITPPPPPPPQHFGMWVSFVYILLFISMYIWSSALAGILNVAVDKYIPDLVKADFMRTFNHSTLQFFGAMMVVGYPIFVVLYLIVVKQSINNPKVRELRSRKLLIYITLIFTFIMIVGNLMTIVYGFFGGNTSLNSLAHFGVTLLVAGSIFGYLLNQVFADRKAI